MSQITDRLHEILALPLFNTQRISLELVPEVTAYVKQFNARASLFRVDSPKLTWLRETISSLSSSIEEICIEVEVLALDPPAFPEAEIIWQWDQMDCTSLNEIINLTHPPYDACPLMSKCSTIIGRSWNHG